jgi:hypothetical protein
VVAGLVALALAAPAVGAAGHAVKLRPRTVARGGTLTVSGAVAGACSPGSRVTVISPAFRRSTTHRFKGKPAVYATVSARRTFSVKVRISRRTPPDRYFVDARCGQRDLGSVILRVV